MNNIINLTKMSLTNLKSVYRQTWIVWIIWIGIGMFNPFFLNMLFGLSILLTLYQIMAYEDNNNIDYLISYLPVKRNEYVISRYLLGLVNLLASTIVVCIVYFISIIINPLDRIQLQLLLPTGITSAILAISVIVPFVLKFGINKGRVFISIITMIISTLPVSLISGISENTKIIDTVINIVNKIELPTIAIIINIMILLISMFISINLYNNKEVKE